MMNHELHLLIFNTVDGNCKFYLSIISKNIDGIILEFEHLVKYTCLLFKTKVFFKNKKVTEYKYKKIHLVLIMRDINLNKKWDSVNADVLELSFLMPRVCKWKS